MWFRSTITNKLVNSSYFKTLDLVYGEDCVPNLISSEFLISVENPSVIDILRDNGSEVAAVMRYREIHNCTLTEARDGVKKLLEDMSGIPARYGPARKKKYHRKKKQEANAE